MKFLRANKTKEMFLKVAGIVADDIYRSANTAYIHTSGMEDYLAASARPLFDYMAQTGIADHYLTNNTFSDLTRPLQVFPLLYDAIGFRYINPLIAARLLIEADGNEPEAFDALFSHYHAEAMMIVNRLISKCHEEKCHYMLLIPDGDSKDFKLSMDMADTKDMLTVLREEATQDSPNIYIFSENVM